MELILLSVYICSEKTLFKLFGENGEKGRDKLINSPIVKLHSIAILLKATLKHSTKLSLSS